MNFNDYINASPDEKINMLFESIKAQVEKKKNINMLTATPSEQIKLIVDSVKERHERLNLINSLTANWTEQVGLMVHAIKSEIIEKARIKINVLTLVMDFLQYGRKYIENQLKQNNLSKAYIDALLDDISPMYKKIQSINKEIQDLKDQIINLDK